MPTAGVAIKEGERVSATGPPLQLCTSSHSAEHNCHMQALQTVQPAHCSNSIAAHLEPMEGLFVVSPVAFHSRPHRHP